MVPELSLLACLVPLLIALAPAALGEAKDPFTPELFADPPGEYRPLQLVHYLDRHVREPDDMGGIDRRLESLRELGVGGVVTNVSYSEFPRRDEPWQILRYGMRKADELGLVLWLYDESGYPSGTAGGVVVRADPELAAEGLACYTAHAQGPAEVVQELPVSCKAFEWACAYPSGPSPSGDDVLDLSDRVDEWGTLRWQAPEGDWTVLYMARRVMYEGTFSTAVPVGHAATRMYINTLDERAVRAFLRVTHEQYARKLPPELWGKVRAVFTDEPLICYHYTGSGPEMDADGRLDQVLFQDRPPAVPWVVDLPSEFRRAKGYDLRAHLYALFTSDAPAAAYVRQDFWDVVAGMYADAYFGQIADWCADHGTAMSGHVLAEENLWGQMMFEGSLMEVVRHMQIPGIDILTADPEALADGVFMAAKTVSSAAHLAGRETVHCECCAFTPLPSGKRLGFDEFIAQANMLHVMGVNLFTLYQNHRQIGEDAFRRYTDYCGRLSLLLRGGSHVCDVAVLYPIRSAWACWTPRGHEPGPDTPATRDRFSRLNAAYTDTGRALAQSQIDFDMVDERAVKAAEIADGAMRVADEAYRAVVLPEAHALDLATARALATLCEAGGTLLAVGRRPELAGSAADQPAFDRLMDELFGEEGPAHVVAAEELAEAVRQRVGADLELAEPDPGVFYTHRRRHGRDVYFIVNNHSEPVTLRPRLRVPGPYSVYRPMTGAASSAGAAEGNAPELTLAPYEGAFLVAGGED